jgi:hypothetical protein
MIKDIQMSFSQLMYLGDETQNDVKEANLTTHKDVDLFLRLLSSKNETIGGVVDKINISFTKDQKQLEHFNTEISDIVTIYLPFVYDSLESYLELKTEDKLTFIYSNLSKAFEKLNKRHEVDLNLIRSLIDECENLEFKNYYYFGKLKSTKDRKHKAGIWIEHGMEVFKLFLDILDKDDIVLKRELIAETSPGYPKYFPLLGGIKWIDNETVEFFNRKKETLKKIVL